MKYWIHVVSQDHVQRGVTGGFTQANHGKPHMLARLEAGDWIIFYSPKTTIEAGRPLQAFTALCQVIDDKPYQVSLSSDFMPWRRNATFKAIKPLPIKPLLTELTFITDIGHWGYKFRFGVFEISQGDFNTICRHMETASASI